MKKDSFNEFKSRVDGYFLYCDAVNEEKGELIKPYTLSGLISHLGITRQGFNDLLSKSRYGKVLECAKSKIEAYIEENALTGELSANASANSLKYNFGWGEKQDKVKDQAPNDIKIVLSPEMSELSR